MKEKFELSCNQKTLWTSFVNNVQGNYYFDICLELSEETDELQVKTALNSVLEKHQILASGLWKDESNIFPMQVVLENNELVDFYHLKNSKDLLEFGHLSTERVGYDYDPMKDSGLRCCFGKLNTGETVFYIRIFALWMDHFSCYYLVNELETFLNGTPANNEEESEMIEYVNFASWQNQTVADPEGDVFWKDFSYHMNQKLIPFGNKEDDELLFVPGKKQIAKLSNSSEGELLSKFANYLNSFGSNELTIGYIPFKPAYKELELTMGAVSRLLPLTISSDLASTKNQEGINSKLEELVEWSDYFEGVNGKLSYHFEYVPSSFSKESNEACKILYTESIGQAFDLKVICIENGDYVEVNLYYNISVFAENEISLITDQLKGVFNGTNILSETDEGIMDLANGQVNDAPRAWSVLQEIQSNVTASPNATALIFENRSITYTELGRLSDQLAHKLIRDHQVQAGDSVALAVERSDWMVIAILGILKSGAFYVPIDVDLPEERIQFIIKDSASKVVIHGDSIQRDISKISAQFVHINEFHKVSSSPLDLLIASKDHDVAYCIYTSGTTGLPKGCLLSHANLNHYINWANQYYYEETDTPANWALITSIAFDLTITSIFSCLTRGGQLWIGSSKKDIGELLESCLDESATNSLKITPSHLVLLNELSVDASSIQRIILGGEKVVQRQVAKFLEVNPETRIFNEYGPTEATVGSVVEELFLETKEILIGKPIERMVVRIVRPDGTKCRIGETGELLLSGAGVSIGYLGKEELNKTKFVSDAEGRWYKTGDLARWTPQGKIDCLGRIDEQLKIRGYRIEPGEIEFQLVSMSSITAAVVLGHLNGFDEKILVAYYSSDGEMSSNELGKRLGNRLPDYMIPIQFIYLKELPLTTNGKVDKNALPNPEELSETKREPYVAPQSQEEKVISIAYEAVLKVDQVGRNDNFFHLGGDSIKAIRIVSELRKSGFTTSIEKVLLLPSPSKLAPQLRGAAISEDNGPVNGVVQLGPIQKKFLKEEQVKSLNYNQAVLLKTQGQIDQVVLEDCLSKLVMQHDMLRARFELSDHGWKQVCEEEVQISSILNIYDTKSEGSFEETAEKLQQSILPEFLPLFRVLLDVKNGNRLLLIAHHLIIDGVSWRILLEDLNNLYSGLSINENVQLPSKSTSFKDWQSALDKYAADNHVSDQKSYWEKVIERSFDFSVGNLTATNRLENTINEVYELSEVQTNYFLNDCYQSYRTDGEMLLLTAMLRSFANNFTLEGLTVLLEGHGRQSISDRVDVSRTIGWFTSLYPVNFDVQKESSISTLLRVKEVIKRIPDKGFAFGLLESELASDSYINPPVTFNYFGEVDVMNQNDGQFFEFSGDSHGNSISPNWERSNLFDVTAMVVNGKLTARITVGGIEISSEVLRSITLAFKQELEGLIEGLRQETNEHLTPSDLTFRELKQDEVNVLNADFNLQNIYTLSPLQEGMYYHWKLAPGSGVYVNQIAYNRHELLRSEQVEKAFSRLIARHPVLRTGFTTDYAGKVLQVVRKNVQIDFKYIDNKSRSVSRNQLLKEDVAYGFDIDSKTLVRLTLVEFSEKEYLFIWSFHHVILDGWCTSILINDFDQYLAAEMNKSVIQLPEVRPFSDYIEWLNGQNKSGGIDYWNEYLSAYENAALVPYQTGKIQQEFSEFSTETSSIENEDFQRLTDLCSHLNITQNSFLQGVWGYLLALYNGSNDVIFGSVVSGRSNGLEGIDQMVGLFINTIPVRCTFEEETTIQELLLEINTKSIESTKYHYQNLAEIQSLSEQGMHLINHIMVFENFALTEQVGTSQGNAISDLQFTDRTNYPFNLVVIPTDTGLKAEFRYDTGHFEQLGMQHLAKEFAYLVNAFASNPSLAPSELEYWPSETSEPIHEVLNASWPEDKTIIDCISSQFKERPDSAAISSQGKQITYGELEKLSNSMANYLIQEKNVLVEDLVGVCLERNEWVVISMLAILKAGGAYVPIDPLYPATRKEFIKKDSGCNTTIDESFIEHFLSVQSEFSSEAPAVEIVPSNAAYVIYTSGTTGLPKGVVVEHRNVVRLLISDDALYDFNHNDVWPMFHSYCFDVSVWEMYGALFYGGKLVMVPSSISKDLSQFADLIVNEGVTILNQTPSVFELLMSFFTENNRSHTIRYVIFAGERLNPIVLSAWNDQFPECRLINMYGITETTVHVTFKELTTEDIQSNISNIGVPIPTLGCFVRDKLGREVPPGIAGELFVAGEGVTRGYLNREELTNERFTTLDNMRVYRSGDIVRKNHAGEMEYLGRNDQQVKIRGYRIETAEIENMLLTHSNVREVRVLVRGEQSKKQICAYYSSDGGNEENLGAVLRSFLTSKLPDYMIPSHFIRIDKIPVTVNGKLDKSKLPEPEIKVAIEPLETGTEIRLGGLWSELLELDATLIGRDSVFFDLGGNSLTAMRLTLELKSRLNCEVAISDIFEKQTLSELAEFIENRLWLSEQGEGNVNLTEIEI